MTPKIEKFQYNYCGLRAEHPIINGKLHGVQKWFDNSGKLLKENTYVNGFLHGPTKYYEGE